jgi:hypothetical protein
MGTKIFYFNTGVKPQYVSRPLGKYEEIRNGTLQIGFFCNDVPDNATFLFASPYGDINEGENVKAFPILEGGLASKFAYFRIIP